MTQINASRLEVFSQVLKGPVWDGNLVSKADRDALFDAGYINRWDGFNFITSEGIRVALALGILRRG